MEVSAKPESSQFKIWWCKGETAHQLATRWSRHATEWSLTCNHFWVYGEMYRRIGKKSQKRKGKELVKRNNGQVLCVL